MCVMTAQDTVRDTCLTDLAGIWYNLVATYSESNPDLAEAVLAAVKRYVSWIDIGLVANDRYEARHLMCIAACCLAKLGGKAAAWFSGLDRPPLPISLLLMQRL